MTQTHIPVLAGELIDLLDPRPGETAVDCTVGGGGHARLIADRIGPGGHADRDRSRSGRRGAVRRARGRGPVPHPVHPRRLRRPRSAELERGAAAGRPALPRPRDVVDAGRHLGARLLVRLRRAARHADGSRPGADRRARSSTPGTSGGSRGCSASTARSATRPRSRARSRALARREELVSTQQLVDAIKAAVPVPAQFAGGHPARRTFQALRIAVNDELVAARRTRCRRRGSCSRPADGWRRSRSTRSRTGASSGSSPTAPAAASARPSCPICVCGREPEAELLTRRAVAPTPGEVAANPEIEVSALARRPQAGGHADMTPTARHARPAGGTDQQAEGSFDRPPRRRARADRRPRKPRRPAARLGPRRRASLVRQRPPAPARTAPVHRAAAPRRPAPATPRFRSHALRVRSRRCPTTRCSTGSSAGGPGSRCSACCWRGSSRCRSRC